MDDAHYFNKNRNDTNEYPGIPAQSPSSLHLIMDQEHQKLHNCDCVYCEYINLQNSITILPTKSRSSNNGYHEKMELQPPAENPEDSTTSILESTEAMKPGSVQPFETSPLFRQWHALLIILRILGSCPLSYKRGKENKRSEVTFRWISWASLYTFVVDMFRIVVCVWYYRDWGHFLLGRRYEHTLTDWIVRSMNYSMPVLQIWDVVVVWMTGERGAKLCNAWIDFHFLFENTFPGGKCRENSRIRKWYLIKGVLMASIAVGMSASTLRELFFGANSLHFEMWHLLRIPPAILLLSMFMLDEVRVLLTYFVAVQSFKNIRSGIEEQLNSLENTSISNHIVTSWTRILVSLRNLVKLTGHLQAPLLIPVFFHSTIIFTGILFLGTQALMTGIEGKRLLLFVLIGGSFAVRLILKIIMAESIVVEEEELVGLLLKTDSKIFDTNGQLELCKIIATMQRKPSKISLSGYITVEKKLIAKIMGQIVSYLVILVQFDLGYYGNNGKGNCTNDTSSLPSLT